MICYKWQEYDKFKYAVDKDDILQSPMLKGIIWSVNSSVVDL